MGEALFELEQVLRSRDGGLTGTERDVFLACRSKSIRDFTIGGSVAAGAVWLASRKLNNFLRINLAGGAAILTGLWRLSESLDSCAENVLAWEGSRMQQELAKILVQRYGHDPRKRQLISKHFYSEKVFDDSTGDHPMSLYRQRNMYVDNSAQNQSTYDSSNDNRNETSYASRNDIPDPPRQRRVGSESRQNQVNSSSYAFADPFECILGYSRTTEELHRPDNSTSPSKTQSRKQRRLHRQHRMRHRHQEL